MWIVIGTHSFLSKQFTIFLKKKRIHYINENIDYFSNYNFSNLDKLDKINVFIGQGFNKNVNIKSFKNYNLEIINQIISIFSNLKKQVNFVYPSSIYTLTNLLTFTSNDYLQEYISTKLEIEKNLTNFSSIYKKILILKLPNILNTNLHYSRSSFINSIINNYNKNKCLNIYKYSK